MIFIELYILLITGYNKILSKLMSKRYNILYHILLKYKMLNQTYTKTDKAAENVRIEIF